MKVAAVDIGTNSMRLLITDGEHELERWVEVTGLGRGVDAGGRLSDEAMSRTLHVLDRYGDLMDAHDVERRRAVATSASRDASNREVFFDRIEDVLGVRPTLISGEEEARLAFLGATTGVDLADPVVVCDIGGGSTEVVRESAATSVDIGSVRLTERCLPAHPATADQLEEARAHVRDFFRSLNVGPVTTLVGVAGTWTSLGAIAQGLVVYDRERVHLSEVRASRLSEIVELLASLTVEETEAIPSLDPERAPVILGGAVVAEIVMEALDAGEVTVSEHDTLDAVAAELLAIP